MLKSINEAQITLKDGMLLRKRQANLDYLMSLNSEALLFNHKFEACLPSRISHEEMHGGWESPEGQLRGHFLGHWLSAAAMHYNATGNEEIKAKAERIVSELANCQRENGGEWVGPIPEKYLHRIAAGKNIWAPQYNLHKTFMGLLDMYIYSGSKQALEVAVNWSRWFVRWAAQFTREQFDDILDVETGGMLEIWAILYGITKDADHQFLMDRYYRSRLFLPLLKGMDVLTNMHANTTIPEVLGAARAYEITGEAKWMDIVRAYWKCAVEDRGQYCTGGQTCGEVWTPKQSMSARLGEKNQEHCTVYNMMRLADFLFRMTGEAKYADYWELNLYNGIFAQGYWKGSFTHGVRSAHPEEGLLTYFLPLHGGARKAWSTRTRDFFCCHGTLVQANATHAQGIYYQDSQNIYVCQFFSSSLRMAMQGAEIRIEQHIDELCGSNHKSSTSTGTQGINDTCASVSSNPNKLVSWLSISCDRPAEFALRIRIPWWVKAQPVLRINGVTTEPEVSPSGFISLTRTWDQDEVYLELPRGLTAIPLPGDLEMTAFLYGSVVLAGRCDEERMLYGDKERPETLLVPDNEREWANWMYTFKTRGQERNLQFIPLHRIGYEPYTVYFPVRKKFGFCGD